ncbi:hypothetical protein PanWU01x14_236090, partial [Parasponia andersonii]
MARGRGRPRASPINAPEAPDLSNLVANLQQRLQAQEKEMRNLREQLRQQHRENVESQVD